MNFIDYIKENYNIDCYVNKIAPDKKTLLIYYHRYMVNGNIIKNTIEKALPRESQSLNLKYINDESWNMDSLFIILQSNKLDKTMNEFIDDLNIVYFQDLIDSNEEFMNRWYSYNNDNNNLEVNKLRLLSIINMDSKASYNKM